MAERWRERVEAEAGGPDGPADPMWWEHLPRCSESCRYHDGKRCELLGVRAPHMCEPVVTEMARVLDQKEEQGNGGS